MNTKYWEEEIETMSRKKLQELQLQRLKKTINIAANAPYYKKVFQEHGITPESIQSLDDIRKLPFTTKADMRAKLSFRTCCRKYERRRSTHPLFKRHNGNTDSHCPFTA